MLDFAIKYRKALDLITSERAMKLRLYELSKEEWEIATHLCDVLKVRTSCVCYDATQPFCQDLQRRNSILLSRHAQHRNSHPGDGSHRLKASNRCEE
jgi:hypothetical protein